MGEPEIAVHRSVMIESITEILLKRQKAERILITYLPRTGKLSFLYAINRGGSDF